MTKEEAMQFLQEHLNKSSDMFTVHEPKGPAVFEGSIGLIIVAKFMGERLGGMVVAHPDQDFETEGKSFLRAAADLAMVTLSDELTKRVNEKQHRAAPNN